METDQQNSSNGATPNVNITLTNVNTQRNRARISGRQQRHRTRRGTNRNNLRSREGFFMHYLFITLSVRYATYFKPTARRLIEFFTLIKAIIMLLLLIYVHTTFVKETGNCLEHIEEIWPRAGVLKVQVEVNTSLPPYQFYFVKQNSDSWATSFLTSPYQAVFKYSLQLGKDGLPIPIANGKKGKFRSKSPNNYIKQARKIFWLEEEVERCPAFNLSTFSKTHARNMFLRRFREVVPEIHFLHMQNEDIPNWVIEDPSISDTVAELKMLQMQEVSGFNIGPQPVRAYYAIEYSTEFGYLRLSALTRHKLGIPVLVVTLDPKQDACFGEGVRRWMMDTFFGYDDLIMSSIKQLAEKDNKQGGGYLRNLVTGEHYKFITLWVSHASYLLAIAVMLVFTLVVTMLLRYSYHQIFVFMVELLHILDMDATPVFPAAPMLTIILALVGTEEIMTEFFHDSTLAFYVILSIWIADQFDAICMHTTVSRRHWVRFFFLYHFAFYAYHYRFNGQFSELALFTSWLFIQHSMFYFFHHYELPAIQRQMRLRQAILQNTRQNTPQPPPDTTTNYASPDNQGSDVDPSTPSTDTHEPSTDQDSNVTSGSDSQSSVPGQTDQGENVGDQPVEESNSVTEPIEGPGHEDTCINSEMDLINEYQLSGDSDPNASQDVEQNDSNGIIWEEDFKSVFENDEVSGIEANISHNSVGIFKYCNLIIFLFFAIISLILIFAFVGIMLNQTGSQGRIGARFGPRGFDNVAGLVR